MYQHVPKKSNIVQKYGGTSVGTPERIQAVATRVARQFTAGYERIAIVVSAMSGETNRLVDLVQKTNPEAEAKFYDMAVAAGEQISVALMAAALQRAGLKAAPLLSYQLGILTDKQHAKARIKSIDTSPIEKIWASGAVPVVAGFQGVTEDLDITTLGRGGSDTSAVALAVALKAAFCEINTDVDGMYTCDPRIVPSARLMTRMDFATALEMASLGSKVLHPRSVELAAKFNMPLIVRNTFQPDDHQRTIIMPQQDAQIEAPVVSGITLDKDVARVNTFGLKDVQKALPDVFSAVAEAGVNVDVIVYNDSGETQKSLIGFTTSKGEAPKAKQAILKQLASHAGLDVKIEEGFVKVSVVGVGMHSHPGVAARTFSYLKSEGITVQMVSTSEIKISCIIAQQHAERACQVLHEGFKLG